MNAEIVKSVLLVICVIALCVIALGKREQRIIQQDPISQRIEAIKGAFPMEDTLSKSKRAELIKLIVNEK